MFHHIVLLRLRDPDAAFLDAAASRVAQVRKDLPFLRSFDLVRNTARLRAGYDWAVLSSFDTAQDFDRYRLSEPHRQLEAFMAPQIVDLLVLDTETGD